MESPIRSSVGMSWRYRPVAWNTLRRNPTRPFGSRATIRGVTVCQPAGVNRDWVVDFFIAAIPSARDLPFDTAPASSTKVYQALGATQSLQLNGAGGSLHAVHFSA